MSPLHDAHGKGDAATVRHRVGSARFSSGPAVGFEIVLSSLQRHEGGTGVQTYVHAVEEHLRLRGRSHRFVNPFTGRSLLRPVLFGARYLLRPVSRPASVRWYRYWHARYLERALRRALRSAGPGTVLFAQCPVSADVALRVRTTQPVVLAAHFNVSQADEWVGKGDLDVDNPVFTSIRAFEERVLPQVDAVVYISHFARRVAEDRIPGLARVTSEVIHGSVAPGRRAGHDSPATIGDLITVGSLEPRKNHAFLLRVLHHAARQGFRYTLSVVGDGPERGRLEELSGELGLTGQVRFLGHVPRARTLMSTHRAYCHAALMESFGLVFVEAMVEGLPVLAGEVGGVPEIVRPGLDGEFWPLDDPAAAAARLIGLLEDPVRLAAMSASARDRARYGFGAEAAGDRLLNLFDVLATSTPRAMPEAA